MSFAPLAAQDVRRFRDAALAALRPSGDEVTADAARIDLITELEHLKSAACALQAELSVDLDASVRSRDARQGVAPERRGRGVAAQIALARQARGVSIRPTPDTMVYLTGLLPVSGGVAAYAALAKQAESLIAQGDERTKSQLMADLLIERITGQATAEAVPVNVDVVISDASLLGAGHEPATIPGWGPVPATIAREIIAHALETETVSFVRSSRSPGRDDVQAALRARRARRVPHHPRPWDLPHSLVRRAHPPQRPRHRCRRGRRDLRAQLPGPVRRLQPQQASLWLDAARRRRPQRTPYRRDHHTHRPSTSVSSSRAAHAGTGNLSNGLQATRDRAPQAGLRHRLLPRRLSRAPAVTLVG
jgi:hypothetical protein